VLGLVVTDMPTARQLRRATGALCQDHHQHCAAFIGYIMAGFTERKQALHDMIAGSWCCGETIEEEV